MAEYIRDEHGKYAGSIGKCKDAVPSAAPAHTVTASPSNAPAAQPVVDAYERFLSRRNIGTSERPIRVIELREVFPDAWNETYSDNSSQGYIMCVACGKRTSPRLRSKGIIIGGGGETIIHPDDAASAVGVDDGFMGWFPIGTECIKDLPIEWRCRPEDHQYDF